MAPGKTDGVFGRNRWSVWGRLMMRLAVTDDVFQWINSVGRYEKHNME